MPEDQNIERGRFRLKTMFVVVGILCGVLAVFRALPLELALSVLLIGLPLGLNLFEVWGQDRGWRRFLPELAITIILSHLAGGLIGIIAFDGPVLQERMSQFWWIIADYAGLSAVTAVICLPIPLIVAVVAKAGSIPASHCLLIAQIFGAPLSAFIFWWIVEMSASV